MCDTKVTRGQMNTSRILFGKLQGKRQLSRPRYREGNNIKVDLQEAGDADVK
jgi:hypothetical protein